jgi:hypothetical protein
LEVVADARHEVCQLPQTVDPMLELGAQKLDSARHRARLPLFGFALLCVRHDLQEGLKKLHACDAVDHAVMRLRDQRPASLRQALDDPQLPERPGPVEPCP